MTWVEMIAGTDKILLVCEVSLCGAPTFVPTKVEQKAMWIMN